MSKIAEKKAFEAYPEHGGKRECYIKGYDQAMQDFLEKAYEWLKDNSKKYTVCNENGYSHYACNSMIYDFKNYMQNESN